MTTYERLPVAMYVMKIAMPKNNSAEPRSRATTNIRIAMPQMQSSGAMKRSGGRRKKPSQRRVFVSTS